MKLKHPDYPMLRAYTPHGVAQFDDHIFETNNKKLYAALLKIEGIEKAGTAAEPDKQGDS